MVKLLLNSCTFMIVLLTPGATDAQTHPSRNLAFPERKIWIIIINIMIIYLSSCYLMLILGSFCYCRCFIPNFLASLMEGV